jgi:hypothetical protein
VHIEYFLVKSAMSAAKNNKVSRPKNILRRNIRSFFASESGKHYSANVSV